MSQAGVSLQPTKFTTMAALLDQQIDEKLPMIQEQVRKN